MSADTPPLVDVRRLATRVAIVLLITADLTTVLLSSRSPLANPDTYFHLRFGQEFWHGWSIAHPGQPNAAGTADWAPTQWLGQLLWFGVEQQTGRLGLALLGAVLISALPLTVYAASRKQATRVPSLVVASTVLIGSVHWLGLRPQLISFVLVAVTVLAWQRARVDGRTPWWLIPTTWIWAMCHGMWVVGVAISAAAVIGLALDGAERRLSLRRALIPLGSLAAAAVTPVGPRLLGAVIAVNGRSSHFSEWAPVPLLQGWGLPVAVVLALVVVLRMRRDQTSSYTVVLLTLAAALALYSGRTLTTGFIVAAPLLAAELSPAAVNGVRRATPFSRRHDGGLMAGAAVLALVAGLIGGAQAGSGLGGVIEPFAARLDRLPSGTTVITDRSYGSVLLWTNPSLEIPVHGYGDVFTDAELQRYDDIGALAPHWDRTLADLHARVALLTPDDRLAYALEQRGWRQVQRTSKLVYLVAPTPKETG